MSKGGNHVWDTKMDENKGPSKKFLPCQKGPAKAFGLLMSGG